MKLKALIRKIFDIYSNKPSYLSKKRVESGLAFVVGEIGYVIYFIYNLDSLTTTEVIALSTLQFTIAGYLVNNIQKQKRDFFNNNNTYKND